MDDAPFTGDLDLGAANTRDDLGVLLRTVHTRADKPSLRTLEARTRHSTTPLSKTAIAEMLKGVRFPRKAVMVTFLQACGVPEDGLESWRRTWERVAASEEASARPKAVQTASGWQGHAAVAGQYPLPVIRGAEVIARPGRADHGHLASEMPATADLTGMRQLREQINWLNGENERLRTQLAAMKPQVVKELSSNDTASSQRAQSPVVCRRDLGTLLRTLRAEKGMTVEQVAEHLMCSQTKVRRMESGFRSGTIRDVRDLCDLYGVTEAAERDRLMELARAGKQQSWWEVYGLPFSTYVGLEMEAASIKTYESSLVPGLVQTEDYARAMIESWVELSPEVIEHSPEVIEKGVEGRLIRQRRLTEANPPRAWFILDEAALHRVVGGRALMMAQLEQLIEIARLPNVTIQVIPYEIGAHPAIGSNFVILEFAGPVDSVAYVEGLVGDLCIERPRDVKQYQLAFETLHSIAWGEKESIARIAKVNKDLRDRS